MKKENIENQPGEDNPISICDLMKGNTSEVLKKMESQIPTYLQLYSDIYKEYIHTIDDLFGNCYISEKEFFDKIPIDQNTLKLIDSNWKNSTKILGNQIDMSTNFLRVYSQMRISAIRAYDQYMHTVMGYYANMLSQFNSSLEK